MLQKMQQFQEYYNLPDFSPISRHFAGFPDMMAHDDNSAA